MWLHFGYDLFLTEDCYILAIKNYIGVSIQVVERLQDDGFQLHAARWWLCRLRIGGMRAKIVEISRYGHVGLRFDEEPLR